MKSAEEKLDVVKKIDMLRASGTSTKDAVKQIGIASSQYYDWRKKNKKLLQIKKASSHKKAFIQDIPIHQPSSPERVMCIIGSSSEIADIIRGIK
jgi:transposase-like protein